MVTDRTYVYVDCTNERTGLSWAHKVEAERAEELCRQIEAQLPGVVARVRARGVVARLVAHLAKHVATSRREVEQDNGDCS